MTGDEVTYLLSLIAACDRKPFPAGAEAGWLMVLEGVDFGDALAAVKRHYGNPAAKSAGPGDIRVLALAERDHNARAAQRALPAAPVRCSPEVREQAMAEIRAITAKFADLDRAPAQRAKPDIASPTLGDADAFERERERQLALLSSRSFA